MESSAVILNESDLALIGSMRSLLFPDGAPASFGADQMLERVFLDPSLQGWQKEEFEELDERGEVLIGDEIVVDPDGPDRGGRVLLLGRYVLVPEPHIVLFPNAIAMVAARPRFREAVGDEQRAVTALTQVVLLHEMAHWLTLRPDIHDNRLALPKGERTALAETLAELVSWLALSRHAEVDPEASRMLLRLQFLLKQPAAGYEYQLYWFWLVFSGLATCRAHLEGAEAVDLRCEDVTGRVEALAKWAILDQVGHDPDDSHVISRIARSGIQHPEALPDFLSTLAGPGTIIGCQLKERWDEFRPRVESLQIKLGTGDENSVWFDPLEI